jgi:hypothetical protein
MRELNDIEVMSVSGGLGFSFLVEAGWTGAARLSGPSILHDGLFVEWGLTFEPASEAGGPRDFEPTNGVELAPPCDEPASPEVDLDDLLFDPVVLPPDLVERGL